MPKQDVVCNETVRCVWVFKGPTSGGDEMNRKRSVLGVCLNNAVIMYTLAA